MGPFRDNLTGIENEVCGIIWSPYPDGWMEPVETPATTAPRILVVDDDPLFCKRINQTAKLKNIPLTVCKSLGDVTSLPTQMPFDVAVLDYYFGELTAFQLAHLIGEDVPVVLISNSEASKITND